MIYLAIEFLDELIYGVGEAAWPLIRNDLHLTYVQIGIALSLPGLLASFIEPFLYVLGDVWKRRAVILGGGLFFTISLLLTGASNSYILFLVSYIIFHPSSGAFVSLSQASLMDQRPDRREQNMARWTFAGSLGVVLGPILLAGAAYLGFGWRGMFFSLAFISAVILFLIWRHLRPVEGSVPFPRFTDIIKQLHVVVSALKNWNVIRWLILLEFSDLMLDVLYGFLPLYFVDAAGFTPAQAALSVAIWTGIGLLGDFLLIPLVERVRGLDYLRLSVLIELVLFPLFLLSPRAWTKLILLGGMGLFNSGWYAILKAKLFDAMHGRSAMALVLDNVSGFFGKLIPLGIGVAAQSFGLAAAMWLLLAGPIVLLLGLPGRSDA